MLLPSGYQHMVPTRAPTTIDKLYKAEKRWGQVTMAGWTATTTGTGSGTQSPTYEFVSTGATASSTALFYTPAAGGWSVGSDRRVVNFSQPQIWEFIIGSDGNNTANGDGRVSFGKAAADGVGDMNDKGWGIKVDQLALTGFAHNGSVLDSNDLSLTMTVQLTYRILIVSDGAGNVDFYVNGDHKTTCVGPTGNGTSSHDIVQVEVANNGDSAGQDLYLFQAKYVIWDT